MARDGRSRHHPDAAHELTDQALRIPGPGTLRRVVRSWRARVAVTGGSMAPGLIPGDWLLVDPEAFRTEPPRTGDLVVAPDPREPERLLVKRVSAVQPDGWLILRGDSPDASTDSRSFGAVQPAEVAGRPWFRYWPPRRVGRIR